MKSTPQFFADGFDVRGRSAATATDDGYAGGVDFLRGISKLIRRYLIDGFAGKVVVMGEHFRNLQTGKVQHYIAAAVIFIFLLLICVVLI